MTNPYEHSGGSLISPAHRLVAITPSDAEPLPRICKALRIWNSGDEIAEVKLSAISGDTVTLHVPPETLWVEDIVTQQVFATGTSAGLVLIGYSD